MAALDARPERPRRPNSTHMTHVGPRSQARVQAMAPHPGLLYRTRFGDRDVPIGAATDRMTSSTIRRDRHQRY